MTLLQPFVNSGRLSVNNIDAQVDSISHNISCFLVRAATDSTVQRSTRRCQLGDLVRTLVRAGISSQRSFQAKLKGEFYLFSAGS